MLVAKVTPEQRRDHQIALAVLRRKIVRAALNGASLSRNFAILSPVDPAAPVRWTLLVEDHAASAKLTRRALEHEGYAVIVADSAADAARQLEIAPPDVIVLDIRLPDRDGLSLLRDLRADPRTRELPVVALHGAQYGWRSRTRPRCRLRRISDHAVRCCAAMLHGRAIRLSCALAVRATETLPRADAAA